MHARVLGAQVPRDLAVLGWACEQCAKRVSGEHVAKRLSGEHVANASHERIATHVSHAGGIGHLSVGQVGAEDADGTVQDQHQHPMKVVQQ